MEFGQGEHPIAFPLVLTTPEPTLNRWSNKLGEFIKRLAAGLLDFGAAVVVAIDEGYRQMDALRIVCMKYGWCFTPDFPLNSLLNSARDVHNAAAPQHELYRQIRAYLCGDNYRELWAMLHELSMSFALGRKRTKILEDSVRVLVSHGMDRFNAANVVVPTLLAVLDGLVSEFALKHHGIANWHSKKNKQIVKRELRSVSFAFDEPAIELLFEVVFSAAHPTSIPTSGRRFNRHHIVHGNWLEFGRMEHALRLFLLVFFIAYITAEYTARKASGDTEPITERSIYSKLLSENFVSPLRESAEARIKSRNLPLSLPSFVTAPTNAAAETES